MYGEIGALSAIPLLVEIILTATFEEFRLTGAVKNMNCRVLGRPNAANLIFFGCNTGIFVEHWAEKSYSPAGLSDISDSCK